MPMIQHAVSEDLNQTDDTRVEDLVGTDIAGDAAAIEQATEQSVEESRAAAPATTGASAGNANLLLDDEEDRFYDAQYGAGYSAGYSSRASRYSIQAKDIKPAEVPENVSVPYVMASGSGAKYDPEKFNAVAWQDVPGFQKFFDMISTMRPMGTEIERGFVEKYILSIEGMQQDDKGNCYICIGDPNPKVMWSCHTDTVHSIEGTQRLEITFDHFLRLPDDTRASCLGADDTAGCFLMLEMIEAQIPGLYVFHWGEEMGRIGSEWLARTNPGFVKGIQACIAFDRKGFYDVITHQCGERCCSQAFVDSIVGMLPEGYKADPTGSFTDSYSYRDLIPECTNLSVGYFNAHSRTECINLYALFLLREALVKFDVEKLVIARDPSARPFDGRHAGRSWGTSGGSRGGSARSGYAHFDLMDEYEERGDDHDGSWTSPRNRRSRRSTTTRVEDLFPPNLDAEAPETMAEIFEIVGEEAAEVLREYYGLEPADLWDMIVQRRLQ